MALLEIESGFWSIRRQMEALVGPRLTNSTLQQAGANGGASFASSFFSEKVDERATGFQACLQAYQAAGFGQFAIETMDWPLGRAVIKATDTFEAWMSSRHAQSPKEPVCAYTAGVLVGFINVVSDRQDVVCIERHCQAQGASACEFELLPASQANDQEQAVAFNPDPGMSRQINLLEMLFDHMPMGIAVIDRDFILRRCNPTWAAFIDEYTPSQSLDVLPGTNIFELEPGTEEVLVPLFNRVFAGETIRQEAVRIESGGIASFWDIVLSPLYENERVAGLLNVSIDATERVQAEQRLRETLSRLAESESMLRSVIENARYFAVYRIQVDWTQPYNGRVVLVSPSLRELTGVEDPYDFEKWFQNLHPEDYPRVIEANRRSLEEGIPYNQPSRFFNERENRWRWVQTISNPGFDAEGQLTHFDGMVIDQTDQKVAELALQQTLATLEQRVEERTRELERRREIAESLRDIIGMINANLPLETFLDRAVTMAAQRLRAAACVLHQIDTMNETITHLASFGMGDIFERGGTRGFCDLKASGGDQYLRATLQRQPTYQNYAPLPVRLDEIRLDPTIPEHIKGERISLRQRFAGSFSVPLFVQNRVYGGMVFYYLEPQDFSDEQIQLGMTFAEQVALAIENAMLRMQSSQAAILSERSRLARDLHDAVTQTLFSASLIAEVLPKLWERNPETGRQKLDELRILTRGALSEMRTLLLELRPDTLAEVDLGDLYQHITNAFTGRTRIPVAFTQEGRSSLPPEVKEVFYRVAQEALNNVAKHSGAAQVWVQLAEQEDRAEVSIRDDGCGFDVSALSPENLGFKIMRERAEAVHAQLDLRSTPGTGTHIQLRWQAGKENEH